MAGKLLAVQQEGRRSEEQMAENSSLLRSLSRLSNLTAKEMSESRDAVSSLTANSSFNCSLSPLKNTPRKAVSFQPEPAANTLNSME